MHRFVLRLIRYAVISLIAAVVTPVSAESVGIRVTDWNAVASLQVLTTAHDAPYVEQYEIGAPPAVPDRDFFGQSIAAWHDSMTGITWLVVGADGENGNTGAAYVFSRATPQSPWHMEARLAANDGATGDHFGFAVGIEGNTIVVGAPDGGNGVIYTFDRDASGTWTAQSETNVASVYSFGYSIAFSGGTLAVGAPFKDSGYVFVYKRFGKGWAIVSSLAPPDMTDSSDFGYSLSMDDQRLLIGAPGDSTIATDRGSAYLFAFDAATASWTFNHKFFAFESGDHDYFGSAVALQGNNAMIGAYGRSSSQGAVDDFLLDDMGNWSEQSPLQAADGKSNDNFGSALVLMGSTLAVGAPVHDSGAGAVYLFTGSAGRWSPIGTFISPNSAERGASLATVDGEFLAGAPDADLDAEFRGRVDVFSNASGDWNYKQSIVASADDNASFGYSVATSADTAFVTAPFRDGTDRSSGAVEIYARDALGNWNWLQSLPNLGQSVGQVLAINGDTAVIGEPDQDFGANFEQGAAYVFVRTRTASGDSWIQQTEFADLGGTSRDDFGSAVAIDGDTVAVGAERFNGKEGVVYVYVRSGTTWSLQSKFSPAEKEANDYFGSAVALRGNRLVVGAPGAAHNTGASYVFERTGSSWTEKKRITASDAAAGDFFGAPVALNVAGDVVVAATDKSIDSKVAVGRVYVFSGSAWTNEAQIDSASPDDNNDFGNSLAVDGNRLAIGEPGANSASLYLRDGASWTLQSAITGDDYARFGTSVALSGATVLVGAPFERSPLQSGRAFFLQDDRIFADGYQ